MHRAGDPMSAWVVGRHSCGHVAAAVAITERTYRTMANDMAVWELAGLTVDFLPDGQTSDVEWCACKYDDPGSAGKE
jgi:hypothetical protein